MPWNRSSSNTLCSIKQTLGKLNRTLWVKFGAWDPAWQSRAGEHHLRTSLATETLGTCRQWSARETVHLHTHILTRSTSVLQLTMTHFSNCALVRIRTRFARPTVPYFRRCIGALLGHNFAGVHAPGPRRCRPSDEVWVDDTLLYGNQTSHNTNPSLIL